MPVTVRVRERNAALSGAYDRRWLDKVDKNLTAVVALKEERPNKMLDAEQAGAAPNSVQKWHGVACLPNHKATTQPG